MRALFNKRFIIRSSFLTAVIFSFLFSSGQVTISGPQCVLKGIDCQYEIRGNWTGSPISVCVQGGVIIENNSGCIQKNSISFIRIKWTTGNSGTVSVTSSAGNATYTTTLTTELNPGVISDTVRSKTINFNANPAIIFCSQATGGACNPAYSYQWQRSTDILIWTNIPYKTGATLAFNASLTETTFFRRKVTEQTSGTVGYSDAAAVYVNPDMTGHQ